MRLVNGHIFGRGLILTAEWSLTEVEAAISEICQACAGEDWPDAARKLSNYLLWEFE